MSGPMKELMTPVIVRSYSPTWAEISDAAVTNSSGWRSRASATTRCSCSSLRGDQSRLTVSASAPPSASRASACAADSSSSPTMTSPSKSMRSVTSETSDRATSCSGLSVCGMSSRRSPSRPASRPAPFMTAIASPWPLVVTRPTFAPSRVMSAFVPVVVPCTTRSACENSSSSDIPNRDAASSIASKKLRARSVGRVGTLPVRIVPSGPMTAQSVNVPPMSTPTLYPSWPTLLGRGTEALPTSSQSWTEALPRSRTKSCHGSSSARQNSWASIAAQPGHAYWRSRSCVSENSVGSGYSRSSTVCGARCR